MKLTAATLAIFSVSICVYGSRNSGRPRRQQTSDIVSKVSGNPLARADDDVHMGQQISSELAALSPEGLNQAFKAAISQLKPHEVASMLVNAYSADDQAAFRSLAFVVANTTLEALKTYKTLLLEKAVNNNRYEFLEYFLFRDDIPWESEDEIKALKSAFYWLSWQGTIFQKAKYLSEKINTTYLSPKEEIEDNEKVNEGAIEAYAGGSRPLSRKPPTPVSQAMCMIGMIMFIMLILKDAMH